MIKMKAYTFTKYGPPEKVLVCRTIDKPQPKDDEVLIKVKAAAVNDYDWCATSGKPYSYRVFFGLFKPKKKMQSTGMEVAGIVEEVGQSVNAFKHGDRVYADTSDDRFGSFAKFMCLKSRTLHHMSENMSFEEAASLPHASMLAYQALFEKGYLEKNQEILINGGGGGVGSLGVQMAKLHNATVTGVDSDDKLSKMKELGFDFAIDYKKEDFTKSGKKYDLILDCKTNRSPFGYLRVLKPRGKYVTIGGDSGKLILLLAFKRLIGWITKKELHMVMLKPNKDLNYINGLYETGKIKAVLDGPYTFEKVPWAIQYFGEARHLGKVVVTVD